MNKVKRTEFIFGKHAFCQQCMLNILMVSFFIGTLLYVWHLIVIFLIIIIIIINIGICRSSILSLLSLCVMHWQYCVYSNQALQMFHCFEKFFEIKI